MRGTGRIWPKIFNEEKKRWYALGALIGVLSCVGMILILLGYCLYGLVSLGAGALVGAYLYHEVRGN